MITKRQLDALNLLSGCSWQKGVSATEFSIMMWPESKMHNKVSNQGNGACKGKAAWLCAGSYLGKLIKKGLVANCYNFNGYYLTELGKSFIK